MHARVSDTEPANSAPPGEPSFAETALKLGGKSEEEVRRTGAIDKADDQVESLFAARFQTAQSPVHRAVWDREVAGRVVRIRAAGRCRRMSNA